MVNSRSCGSAGARSGRSSSAHRTCAGCGLKILQRFLLYSMERYWHTPCLKCSCCQAQLAEIGTSCYTRSGMILCRNDYIRLFGNGGACRACGRSIPSTELVMRARGSVYHLECFACATCRNRLVPGDSFHFIDGTIFCEHHQPPVKPGRPITPQQPDHKCGAPREAQTPEDSWNSDKVTSTLTSQQLRRRRLEANLVVTDSILRNLWSLHIYHTLLGDYDNRPTAEVLSTCSWSMLEMTVYGLCPRWHLCSHSQ